MKVRVLRAPSSHELDEFDVSSLRVGEVVEVSARLATALIISGDAEPVVGPWDRAEAHDASARSRKVKPEPS
jgi:hypothetical protein